MPDEDLVYVELGTFELAGWVVGTSPEEDTKLREAHHHRLTIWTYRHFCDYWKQMYYDGVIPELPYWADRRK